MFPGGYGMLWPSTETLVMKISKTGAKSCFDCKHYHAEKEIESWELSHIFWWEHSCSVRPNISNLKQFPFSNTTCQKYERTS